MANDAQTSEDIKEIVVRFISQVQGQGRFELTDELVSDDFHHHGRSDRLDGPTKAGMVERIRTLREAFPDLRVDIHEVVVDGDKAWMYKTLSGTHVGDLYDRRPSNKKVAWNTVDMFTVREGKIVMITAVADMSEVDRATDDAQ
jgi:predicted ester cyclase